MRWNQKTTPDARQATDNRRVRVQIILKTTISKKPHPKNHICGFSDWRGKPHCGFLDGAKKPHCGFSATRPPCTVDHFCSHLKAKILRGILQKRYPTPTLNASPSPNVTGSELRDALFCYDAQKRYPTPTLNTSPSPNVTESEGIKVRALLECPTSEPYLRCWWCRRPLACWPSEHI